MKNIGWCMLIGLFTIVLLNAQETGSNIEKEKEEYVAMPKHIIKVFPLDALGGSIGLGYERVIRPKRSLNFVLFQGFAKPNFVNNVSERSYYLFSEAGLRFYLSKQKKAPEGLFVNGGLFARYTYDRLKNKVNSQIFDFERIQVGGFGRIGYQWIFKKALKGFSTEVEGGVDYRVNTEILDGGPLNPFDINLNVSLGYSW